jgi:hypothetical protein
MISGFNYLSENTVSGTLGGTVTYTVPADTRAFLTASVSASKTVSGRYMSYADGTTAVSCWTENASNSDSNSMSWQILKVGDVVLIEGSAGQATVKINGTVALIAKPEAAVSAGWSDAGAGPLPALDIVKDGESVTTNENASFSVAEFSNPTI